MNVWLPSLATIEQETKFLGSRLDDVTRAQHADS